MRPTIKLNQLRRTTEQLYRYYNDEIIYYLLLLEVKNTLMLLTYIRELLVCCNKTDSGALVEKGELYYV